MKILQLISSAGFFGAENVVLELSRELGALNIENIIGVFENSQNPHIEIAENARKYGLKTEIFKCRGKADIKTIFSIKKFIKDNGIDIIHTHGYKSNFYGLIAAKLLKKPAVSTCHNWIPQYETYYRSDKYTLRFFNKVVGVSESVRNELLKNNVREDKISIIFNGVNINRFEECSNDLRDEFQIAKKVKVIGTVARFTEEKGLLNLVETAREISNTFENVRFMIVGDGPLRGELEKKSAELGIAGKVIFTGLRSDLPEVYSTFDIFVLPSLQEGLPMVLLEAMAAKKPIVATTVGAIPRVLTDRVDGLLVSPGDIDGLKAAIISLLRNEGLSNALAYSAYNKVKSEFSSGAMCARYVQIYDRLFECQDFFHSTYKY